jgi:hypothetical protein
VSHRRLLCAAAALAALVTTLAAVPVGGAGVPTPAPAPATARTVTSYVDPVGDAKGPLDVRLVDIIIQSGNVMRMSVTIPNSPTIADRQVLGVVFDTDLNSATGSNGADFYWSVIGNADGSASFTAYRWTNGAWARYFIKTFNPTPWSNGQTISFSLAELGSTSFNFAVYTKAYDANEAWDWAPNSGKWSFRLAKPAPKPTPKPKPAKHLAFGAAATSPRTPTSGLPFYVAPSVKLVTASGSSGITHGTVRCVASVRGRSLAAIMRRVSRGKGVVCGWRIPSGSSGSTLAASVVVSSDGMTVRKAYRWKVT